MPHFAATHEKRRPDEQQMSLLHPTQAIIFDMDGVLSDTQNLHAVAESILLKQYGINITPDEITRRFAGFSDHEFYVTVFREAGKSIDSIDRVIDEKWEPFLKNARGHIEVVPGAIATVRRMQAAGFRLAVASASIPEFIQLVVTELAVADAFGTLTSATEVAKGKPAPDIFLLAAQRLGIKPQSCVVIEDGVNGMMAARRAGMKCIGLVRAHLAALHPDYPADVVVGDHQNITVELIERLLTV